MSDYLAHSRCRYRRRRKLVDKLWTSILRDVSGTMQEKNGIPGHRIHSSPLQFDLTGSSGSRARHY